MWKQQYRYERPYTACPCGRWVWTDRARKQVCLCGKPFQREHPKLPGRQQQQQQRLQPQSGQSAESSKLAALEAVLAKVVASMPQGEREQFERDYPVLRPKPQKVETDTFKQVSAKAAEAFREFKRLGDKRHSIEMRARRLQQQQDALSSWQSPFRSSRKHSTTTSASVGAMQVWCSRGFKRDPTQMRILNITQLGIEIQSALERSRLRGERRGREQATETLPPADLGGFPREAQQQQRPRGRSRTRGQQGQGQQQQQQGEPGGTSSSSSRAVPGQPTGTCRTRLFETSRLRSRLASELFSSTPGLRQQQPNSQQQQQQGRQQQQQQPSALEQSDRRQLHSLQLTRTCRTPEKRRVLLGGRSESEGTPLSSGLSIYYANYTEWGPRARGLLRILALTR